jgi:hypothetical protein
VIHKLPVMRYHQKRRALPEPGSIPAVLDSFRAEVRFYQQIAPEVGVRVPACYRAAATPAGTELVLEDLSDWAPGADPAQAARVLRDLHQRWENRAHLRWPWLRRSEEVNELVEALLAARWPCLAERGDLTSKVSGLGARLVGPGRVTQAIVDAGRAGPPTLAHGDVAAQNLRTSSSGEVALLDWEDVGASPGADDLGWLLVSSTDPARWDEVIAAYGSASGLTATLPSAVVQGLLTLDGHEPGSAPALAWVGRLEEAADRLAG